MCKGSTRQYSSSNHLVSLFVDNLPEDTSHSWLTKLFNNYGVVKEVFIPGKRSKATGRRFAFVRYDCGISADVAISNTHGMWIEECKLFVKRASFGMGEKSEPRYHRLHSHSHLLESSTAGERTKVDHPIMSMLQGKSYASAVKGESGAKGLVKEKVITLRLQAEETDWLSSSAVAKSHLDVAVDELVKNLNLDLRFEVQIRSLGGRNFLLTFPTAEVRNRMIQDKAFGRWFSYLQPWTGEAAGVERLAWLSCFGVPLNAWGQNLFKNIGNNWGSFIRTDVNTSKFSSFDKGRILIATEAKSKIDAWINVEIKGVCYPVKVIEEDYYISKFLNEDDLSDSSSGDEKDKEETDVDIPIDKTTNLNEDNLSDSSLGEEKDKEETDVDIPIDKTTNVVERGTNSEMAENNNIHLVGDLLEVGKTNLDAVVNSQSRVEVDVSSNSCVGEDNLALEDGDIAFKEDTNSAAPLNGYQIGLEYESLAADEAGEVEDRVVAEETTTSSGSVDSSSDDLVSADPLINYVEYMRHKKKARVKKGFQRKPLWTKNPLKAAIFSRTVSRDQIEKRSKSLKFGFEER